MDLLGEFTATFLLIISWLAPSDVVTMGDMASDPPITYVIPVNEFHQTMCGCPCSAGGVYLGEVEIGGIKGKTIFLAGIPYNGVYYVEPGQAMHEFIHYRQDLEGRMLGQHELTEENQKQLRVDLESEAYEVQNTFYALNGLPQINIDEGVKDSNNWAAGRTQCVNNAPPIPIEERKTPEQLVLEFAKPALDYYKNTR